MTALLLQTLLLMVPAFFIGAALACFLRRMITPAREVSYAPVRSQATPVEPLPQYAQRNTSPAPVVEAAKQVMPAPSVMTAATNKFDQALRPAEVRPAPPPPPAAPPPAASAPAAPVQRAPQPAAPAASATAEKIASAAAAVSAATAAIAAQAAAAKPAPTPAVAVPAPATPVVAPAPAPKAVAPAAPASTAAIPAARPAVAETAAADDLTRISAIDGPLSQQLAKLGITRYSQIAGWRKPDVEKISQSLGYQGRIEQENWIEQAQILAGGGETFYSARRAKSETSSGAPTPTTVPATAPKVEERAAFAQKPTTAPVSAPVPKTSVPVPSDRVAVQPSAPAPASRDVMSAAAAAAAAAAASIARPAATPPPATSTATVAPPPPAATAIRPTIAPARDTLQRIGSISPELEKLLYSQGINRYTQIASWGSGEIERFDRLLGSQGRIARENWVEQAQILAKNGDTAHSRDFDRRMAAAPKPTAAAPAASSAAPAAPSAPVTAAPSAVPAPAAAVRPMSITEAIKANAAATTAPNRPNIAGLRSVRSEAYTSATDAATAAAAAAAASQGSAKVVRSAEIDDLKRIRGIGVLIEKRLNQVGIVNYGQIAEWTTDEIDRISATLDFKGRIERENWVEQARILASGGQTEFSRRVDRGEVETSKPRPVS